MPPGEPSPSQVTAIPSHRAPELFPIIFEDPELLVINKPAGLVCHPTKGGAYSSLISRVRLYLGEGSPAHLINRLDRETSGVILVAKQDDAAFELRRCWESRSVRKEYLAIVSGWPSWTERRVEAPLGRDTASVVAIKDTVVPGGAESATDFRVLRPFERKEAPFALVEAVPLTGRKHQIRIHAAFTGHPIAGDKLYGPDETLYLKFVKGELTPEDWSRLILPNHALHAASITFPWRGAPRHFQAEPDETFRRFLGSVSREIESPPDAS